MNDTVKETPETENIGEFKINVTAGDLVKNAPGTLTKDGIVYVKISDLTESAKKEIKGFTAEMVYALMPKGTEKIDYDTIEDPPGIKVTYHTGDKLAQIVIFRMTIED